MKKPIQIWIYHNQEFIGKYSSMKEAAERAGVPPHTVFNIAHQKTKSPCTRQGFHFSLKQLTEKEIEQLPIMDTVKKTGYTRVDGRACKQLVEDAVYEVPCKNPQVCYLGRSKQERLDNFKTFLFTKFRERWLIIDKRVATLERQFIREMLKSLE